jgi:pyruvate/2-oxoglutarate/acetoin dehydrogenase E1 component
MKYLEHIQRGMDYWASVDKTIFVGQAMEYKGHAVSRQVNQYPKNKLLELPVMEDSQAGICLGLAIEGYIPICVYPRNDFTILACNQIFNHIDRWPDMFAGNPKIIIKCVVGSNAPLNPGPQHRANYFEAFDNMAQNITCFNLTRTSQPLQHYGNAYIDHCYKTAINEAGSFIIVEDAQLYQDG